MTQPDSHSLAALWMNPAHPLCFSPSSPSSSCSLVVVFQTKNGREVPMEVVVMLKLEHAKKTCLGAFAPITMLEWFALDKEMILVLERPLPANNLLVYRDIKGRGCLEEGEARVRETVQIFHLQFIILV